MKLKLALLASIAIALTMCVAELGLRVAAHALDKGRATAFHPDLGWLPLPEIEKDDPQWGADVPGWTNASGFRDQEHPFAKPDGSTRIVALGDSFTFGYGVDFGDRFSEMLESDVPSLEVVNLGVFAYGTDQELRVFETHGCLYEPDVVLLMVYLGNDLDDIACKVIHSWPKPFYLLEGDTLERVEPRETWDIVLRGNSYLAELVFKAIERSEPKTVRASAWADADTIPLFVALVRALESRAQARGARFLAVVIDPRAVDPADSERFSAARRGLVESGIQILDTAPAFASGEERGLYLPDGHWSPAGHRVAADLIRDGLQRRGWLDD